MNEVEVQAKLHGKEFKKPPQALGVTKKQRAEFDEQALSVYERLKKRHLENKVFNKNG